MSFTETLQVISENIDATSINIPEALLGKRETFYNSHQTHRLEIFAKEEERKRPRYWVRAPCKTLSISLLAKRREDFSWATLREIELEVFENQEIEMVVLADGFFYNRPPGNFEGFSRIEYTLSNNGVGSFPFIGGIVRIRGFESPEKARRELEQFGFVHIDDLPGQIDVVGTVQGIINLAIEQLEKQQQGQVDEDFPIPELVIP